MKELTLIIIFYHVFGDNDSNIKEEINEFKVKFTRPYCNSIYNSYLIAWNERGEFTIFGVVGKEKPVALSVNWNAIEKYLKAHPKAKQHLNIKI